MDTLRFPIREPLRGSAAIHPYPVSKGELVFARGFSDNRPLTTCALTRDGRTAFGGYVDLLEEIIKQARGSK